MVKILRGQRKGCWRCCTVVYYQSNFPIFIEKFLSNAQIHSSNRALYIQLFCCDLYQQRRSLTFLKHYGFLDFPIKNIGSSSPTAFAAATPLILSYYASSLSTCKTLNGKFCLLDIDKRDQIYHDCIYLLSCTGKGESVRMFYTKVLSSQVTLNYFRQR